MIDFGNVGTLIVPEGEVAKVIRDGAMIWKRPGFEYVSLGDSIAAGHAIDDSWEKDYGYKSQYGENGNAITEIVPGCYTDVIRGNAVKAYGESRVTVTSYAHSGDTVADLIAKLSHETVRAAIADADMVTICIGANDVLQAALSNISEYIETGSLAGIEAEIEANMAKLGDDSYPYGYKALMDKLTAINGKAKFAFMTVYNPYKYLWLDESKNGFFAPLLATIPDMDMFGIDIDGYIKDGLLSTPAVQTLFSRVNGLNSWTEARVSRLNDILRSKAAAAGGNFVIADVKAAYDLVPDRPVSAEHHYNDLVNVEYTRGYDTMQMDWGALWRDEYGDNVASYWIDLATDYVSWSGLDVSGLASELVSQMIEKVIVPDMDPHPEPYGHEVIASTFIDALG